jgi:hypothetical protein
MSAGRFRAGRRGRVLQFSVALLFPLIVGLVTYFLVGFFSRGARATRRRKALSLETVGGPEQQLHKLNGNFDRILHRWFRPVALILIGASGTFVFVWSLLSSDAWSILSTSAWELAGFSLSTSPEGPKPKKFRSVSLSRLRMRRRTWCRI